MTQKTVIVELDYKRETVYYMTADARYNGNFPLGADKEQSLRRARHDIGKNHKVKVGDFHLLRETPSSFTYYAIYEYLTC